MSRRPNILARFRHGIAGVLRGMGLSDLSYHFASALGMGGDLTRARPTRSYSQVSVIYCCVRAKASALSMLPMRVSTRDDEVIESGPVAELLACPHPQWTARAFAEATSAYLDLFGRCHWRKELSASGVTVSVQPVSPLLMRPDVDRVTGELRGWKYRPAHGQAADTLLSLDEVHTITDPDFSNPAAIFDGLGPREAVTNAVNQYFGADVANLALLDNGVAPSGAFKTEGDLSEAQRRGLRAGVADRHQGARNRHDFMVLEGGLDWVQMGAALKDMEFTELKRMTRTDICSAFGVPPSVAGFYENDNYAHAEKAAETFWTGNILSRAARLAEEWELGVLRTFNGDRSLRFVNARRSKVTKAASASRSYRQAKRRAFGLPEELRIWHDATGVPEVARASLAGTTPQQWNQMGVPLNAIIRATDAPFEEVEWGETWYKPIGSADVQDDTLAIFNDPPGTPGSPAPE
ncbi:MAG: phage portal protein, partial [Planctomycetota bacterium]